MKRLYVHVAVGELTEVSAYLQKLVIVVVQTISACFPAEVTTASGSYY